MEVDLGGYCIRHINDEIGKGVFALRDIRKGESIFREKPLVSSQFSWNRFYKYEACDFCLEPLETAQDNVHRLTGNTNILLPNSECCTTRPGFHVTCPHCGIKYCSRICLTEAAEKYHKTLCLRSPNPDPGHPLVVLEELWKSFHYPPESCTIQLVTRILASVIQNEPSPRNEHVPEVMSFCHDVRRDETTAHKLLGPQFTDQLEQLRTATANFFGEFEAVRWFLAPEGFANLIALIGRNGQGIGTSAFSQWVKNVEKLQLSSQEKKTMDDLIEKIYAELEKAVGLEFLNNEGSGLFLRQSAINHSCDPNAVVEFPFNNHECVVNALKNIGVGEEILISYLDDCEMERSRHSRQKALRENYLFTCHCTKCTSQVNDPDVTSEEEMSAEDGGGDDDDEVE